MDATDGRLIKTKEFNGLRPYFISSGNHLYGIVNNAKRIQIYNLELDLVEEIPYDDKYDKIYFNVQGADIILKHGRLQSIAFV